MTGNWNNGHPYYRCRFPAEYALANKINHPKGVYLREADITGPLDDWLTTAFAPARLDATITELATHSGHDTSTQADAARAPHH